MFDARMTRRSAVALCATLLLAGCGAGEPAAAGSTGSAQDAPAAAAKNVAWEAKLDADAPFMNVEGDQGAAQSVMQSAQVPEVMSLRYSLPTCVMRTRICVFAAK